MTSLLILIKIYIKKKHSKLGIILQTNFYEAIKYNQGINKLLNNFETKNNLINRIKISLISWKFSILFFY